MQKQQHVLQEAITSDSFAHFALKPEIQQALQELGYLNPTEIQVSAIPLALKGEDFIGQAKTGTGKTAAFGLPMLTQLQPGQVGLVLVPTRELALQVQTELHKFSKHLRMHIIALYGGQSINVQIDALRRAVDVIVATPGRLLDHLERRTVSLANVRIVVLDEADRMLDMGFRPDITTILQQVPRERQTMLFSATMQDEVLGIAQHYMRSTQKIGKSDQVVVEKINQEYYLIERNRKISLLVQVLRHERVQRGIIFCSTRRQVDFLAEKLHNNRFHCMAIHAGLRQARRDKVMGDFRSGKATLLIATDVAARGLDIQDVSHVINYDFPQSAEDYVHRIGRTARAGKDGKAISLVTNIDAPNFLDMEKAIGMKVQQRFVDGIATTKIESLDIETLRQQMWVEQERRGRGAQFTKRGAYQKKQEDSFDGGAMPYNIMD